MNVRRVPADLHWPVQPLLRRRLDPRRQGVGSSDAADMADLAVQFIEMELATRKSSSRTEGIFREADESVHGGRTVTGSKQYRP